MEGWSSGARRLVMKPDQSGDGYVLWANGKITALGAASTPAFTPDVSWGNGAFPYGGPAIALVITSWAGPSGYVVDYLGGVHAFGGATASTPTATIYSLPAYVDASMDPAGNGEGYLLTINGDIEETGGASPQSGFNLFFQARRIYWDWTGDDGYVLDAFGGIHPLGGAVAAAGAAGWPQQPFAAALAVESFVAGSGWTLDSLGSVHPFGSADDAAGGPRWPTWEIARDLVIFGTDPLRFKLLDGQGSVHTWTVSHDPTAIAGTGYGPADPTTDTTRPVLTFAYSDVDGDSMLDCRIALFRWDSTTAFDNEVRTITRLGSPTGGTFKLEYEGKVTGTIAYNATGATIQTAVRAAWNNCADVTVTGPAGGPWVMTFLGARAQSRQRNIRTVNNAMTGGSNPRLSYEKTTLGTNPFTRASKMAEWTVSGTGAQILDFDLSGGPDDGGSLDYRFYVRARDTSGRTSGDSMYEWTQNVDRPDAPTVELNVRGGVLGIGVGVTLNSPPAGSLLEVQYSDDYNPGDPLGGTWYPVANTYMVPGEATVDDLGTVGDLFGINGWPLETGGGISGNNLAKLAHIGGKHLRFTEEWDWIEGPEGTFDFTTLDGYIAFCRAYGFTVCTSLLGAPAWSNPHTGNTFAEVTAGASSDGQYHPAIGASNKWLPIDDAARAKAAAFAVLIASRLDPETDILEIWNEPNIQQFNAGLYSDTGSGAALHSGFPLYQGPASWARLVAAVIPVVRAFYPSLKIMAGGFGTVGDLNAPLAYQTPSSPGNRIDFSPGAFVASAAAAVPEILTTAAPDYWGVHTYNYGGGELNYPHSLPNTEKGWGGHLQADVLRDTLKYLGITNPQIMVTESGAPGALPTSSPINYGESDAAVAAGYTEGFQAFYHAVDQVEILTRVSDGRYTPRFYMHTLSERVAETNIVERFYGLYRGGPATLDDAIKPAGTIWKNKLAEVLTVGEGPAGPTQIVDLEARFTKPRYYRAQVYTPTPWLASPWSPIQSAILTGGAWVLSIPDNPLAQMIVDVVPPFRFTRAVVGYVAQPAGADVAIAVTDGGVRGASATVKARVLNATQYAVLQLLIDYEGTLLLRDPFGRAWYTKFATDDLGFDLLHAQKVAFEDPEWLTRHAHEIDLPITEVARPVVSTGPPSTAFFTV